MIKNFEGTRMLFLLIVLLSLSTQSYAMFTNVGKAPQIGIASLFKHNSKQVYKNVKLCTDNVLSIEQLFKQRENLKNAQITLQQKQKIMDKEIKRTIARKKNDITMLNKKIKNVIWTLDESIIKDILKKDIQAIKVYNEHLSKHLMERKFDLDRLIDSRKMSEEILSYKPY